MKTVYPLQTKFAGGIIISDQYFKMPYYTEGNFRPMDIIFLLKFIILNYAYELTPMTLVLIIKAMVLCQFLPHLRPPLSACLISLYIIEVLTLCYSAPHAHTSGAFFLKKGQAPQASLKYQNLMCWLKRIFTLLLKME